MRCTRCGCEIPEGRTICGQCGMSIGGNVYGQPQQSQSQYSQPQYSQQWQNQPQYNQPQYGQQWQNQSQQSYAQPSRQTWTMPNSPNVQGQFSEFSGYGQQNYGQNMQQQMQGAYGQNLQQMQGVYGQSQQSPQSTYGQRADDAAMHSAGRLLKPNFINMAAVFLTILTVYLPYAGTTGTTMSIGNAYSDYGVAILLGILLLLADFVCLMFNQTACYIVTLVISAAYGIFFIVEFILTLIDMKRLDASVGACLKFGAWFSLVAAVLLIVSVPIWWVRNRVIQCK